MQISVQLPSGQSIALDVEANDTIDNVKAKIQDAAGFDPSSQTLTFGPATLQDGQTLADYGIGSNAVIVLSVPVTTTTSTTAPTTTSTTQATTTSIVESTTSTTELVVVETTAVVVAPLANGSQQLPVTGSSDIALFAGLSLVLIGSFLQRMARRLGPAAS